MISTKKRFIVQVHVYEIHPSKTAHFEGAHGGPDRLESIASYEIEGRVDLLGTTVITATNMVHGQYLQMLKALEVNVWPKLAEAVERWHRG